MLSGFRLFALLALTLLTATGASAQCHIGVYSNAEGTSSFVTPTQLEPLSVYVVLFAEDLVNGVAYQLSFTGDLNYFIPQSTTYGPGGGGIGVTDPLNGSPVVDPLSVGLGTCASGFQGTPIVVAEYRFLPISDYLESFVYLYPHPSEDPSFPVYSTCQGIVKQCTQTSSLYIGFPDAAESTSMSAVKSLYN